MDRTYYIQEMRARIGELTSEINKMNKEIETFETVRSLSSSLSPSSSPSPYPLPSLSSPSRLSPSLHLRLPFLSLLPLPIRRSLREYRINVLLLHVVLALDLPPVSHDLIE